MFFESYHHPLSLLLAVQHYWKLSVSIMFSLSQLLLAIYVLAYDVNVVLNFVVHGVAVARC